MCHVGFVKVFCDTGKASILLFFCTDSLWCVRHTRNDTGSGARVLGGDPIWMIKNPRFRNATPGITQPLPWPKTELLLWVHADPSSGASQSAYSWADYDGMLGSRST
jgi:hypothetical protein